jgi:hypothetical protein
MYDAVKEKEAVVAYDALAIVPVIKEAVEA